MLRVGLGVPVNLVEFAVWFEAVTNQAAALEIGSARRSASPCLISAIYAGSYRHADPVGEPLARAGSA
jgi:hypothetical protein